MMMYNYDVSPCPLNQHVSPEMHTLVSTNNTPSDPPTTHPLIYQQHTLWSTGKMHITSCWNCKEIFGSFVGYVLSYPTHSYS